MALEYELVEDNHHREIEIHIPSDANMKWDACKFRPTGVSLSLETV